MPHDINLIVTIAAGFGLALVFGFIASHLRMPPLVGYLLAGVMIGPGTPGYVADMGLAAQLAEIGVMLLMFGVGLHFSMNDLVAVRRIAVPGAIVQIAAATFMGACWGHFWMGWGWGPAVVFGLCLSVASTVVLLKALEAKGQVGTLNGQIAVGWLVVEDLLMVLVLVLLPSLAGLLAPAGSGIAEVAPAQLWSAVGMTLAKVAAFMVLMLVVGKRVLPRLLWWVARTGSRELFTLGVVVAAVGVAVGAAELFEVSFALGAFFAGMMMRESEFSHRAAEESLPLRDAFAVLFFVSVGMLFKPQVLLDHPGQVLAVLAIIVLGKTVAAVGLVRLMNYPLSTALTVGASLAQIGEFSFILASLAVGLGLMTPDAHNLVLAGAILSIALNSAVFAALAPWQRRLCQASAAARRNESNHDPLSRLPDFADASHRRGQVVLVGHGQLGQGLASTLAAQGASLVIVDSHREQVSALRDRQQVAIWGDATLPETLVQAQVAQAAMMVVSLPDALGLQQVVEAARALQPQLPMLVSSHSEEEAALLRREFGDGLIVMTGDEALAQCMSQFIGSTCAAKLMAHAGTAPRTALPEGIP